MSKPVADSLDEFNGPFLNDVIEWDIATWSRSLEFWRKHTNLNWAESQGLELGARRGGLSLWFSNQGASMTCSDINSPESDASPIHQRYQLNHQINYCAIDACNIPHSEAFDFITFKSILGGIARNNELSKVQQVVDSAWQALKPGGELMFCENLSGTPFHHLARQLFVRWGKEWTYLKISFLLEILNKFEVNWATTGCLSAFGRNENHKKKLAKLDQFLIKVYLPHRFQYVFMAVAKKIHK